MSTLSLSSHAPRRVGALAARCALLLAVAAGAPAVASAQLPGLPVLPEPFAGRGLAVAANLGLAEGRATPAAAFAWAPGSRRLIVSGGAGAYGAPKEYRRGALAVGGRLAVPVLTFASGRLGVAPFAGYGEARARIDLPAGAADTTNDQVTVRQIPVGASVGWRSRFGAQRAWSVFAAPMYSWQRLAVGDDLLTAARFRIAAGAAVTLSRTLGVTLGWEGGASAPSGEPGPRSGLFGAGLSYAPR